MDDKRDRIRVSQLFIIYNGSIEHLGNISKRAWGATFIPQNHLGKRLKRLPMSPRRAAISSTSDVLGSENKGRAQYFLSKWSTIGL